MIEFTLVALPLMFVLTGFFTLGIGMWNYHTVSNAAREGARFAARHANECTQHGNNCAATQAAIARVIRSWSTGLAPYRNVQVTLRGMGSVPTVGPTSLTTMMGNTSSYWPTRSATAGTVPGGKIGDELQVEIAYPFGLSIVYLPVGDQPVFPPLTFRATSREMIQY